MLSLAMGPFKCPVSDGSRIGQGELILDVVAVRLDGVQAQAKFFADLARAETAANQRKYLQLTLAQASQPRHHLSLTATIAVAVFGGLHMCTGLGIGVFVYQRGLQKLAQFTAQCGLMLFDELLNTFI